MIYLILFSVLSLFLIIISIILYIIRKKAKKEISTGKIGNITTQENFIMAPNINENDCGVMVELQTLKYLGYEITYNEVLKGMAWNENLPNLTDTHLNHMKLLKSLGIKYKLSIFATQDGIVDTLLKDIPVIVLLNLGTFSMHWVVIFYYTDNKWLAYWANGCVKIMDNKYFNDTFTGTTISINRKS